MSDTNSYRYVGINHRDEDGELLDDGEVVEMTDEEYALFAHKFEPADDASSSSDAGNSEDEDEGDGEGDIDGAAEFVDNKVGPVVDAIEDGTADGHLADVRDAENDGRDRSTVHDALDARAEETGEDAGERA